MSLKTVRWFLTFYNFFALVSLKIENEKFKVSKVVAASNLLKMPLVFMFSSFVLVYPPLMEKIYDFELKPFDSFSLFAAISMWIAFSVMNISCFLFCVVQFSNRRKMQELGNICSKMKLQNKFQKKFQSNCRHESWKLLFIFVSLTLSQYATVFKGSLYTIACNFIISYPNMMLFAYASILKNFEYFVTAHLDSFQCNLNDAIERDSHKIETLLTQFRQIYNISEDFNKAFGSSFSIFITAFFLMSIFNVSFKREIHFPSIMSFLFQAGFQFNSICQTL